MKSLFCSGIPYWLNKANFVEKIADFSKKDKEYEFSVLSDQSKKSKIFPHMAQNSLSMDELSSIMSSSKKQKNLSNSLKMHICFFY